MSEHKNFNINVAIPEALHRRARSTSKRHRIAVAQLIREGLTEKLDRIEEKERFDRAREQQEQKSKTEKRRKGVRIDDESLRPSVLDEERGGDDPAEPIDPLYFHHAELIARAYGNPSERRIAALTGVKAICDARPLTSDPLEVERRLADVVKKVRAEMSADAGEPRAPAHPPAPKPEPARPGFIERLLTGNIFDPDKKFDVAPLTREFLDEDVDEE